MDNLEAIERYYAEKEQRAETYFDLSRQSNDQIRLRKTGVRTPGVVEVDPALRPPPRPRVKVSKVKVIKEILSPIQIDPIELENRYLEERCLNCGDEREAGGTFCTHCFRQLPIDIKAAYREFKWSMRVSGIQISSEQMRINDIRKRNAKQQAR